MDRVCAECVQSVNCLVLARKPGIDHQVMDNPLAPYPPLELVLELVLDVLLNVCCATTVVREQHDAYAVDGPSARNQVVLRSWHSPQQVAQHGDGSKGMQRTVNASKSCADPALCWLVG